MTKLEKLQHDINTMRESIRLQWSELADIPLSEADHHAARAAIWSLVESLKYLLDARDKESANAERT